MRYLIKRAIQGIVTFVAATTIAFVLYRMLPGGPVSQLVSQEFQQCVTEYGAAECNIEDIRRRVEVIVNIDPDKPIPQAYVDYMADIIVHQDFGRSTKYQEPVFDLLFMAMPWSIFISIHGLALGWTFNIFFGSLLAYKEGSRFDKAGTIFAIAGNSTPYYVAAIFALALFAYELNFFPRGGRYPGSMYLSLPMLGPIVSEPNVTPGVNLPFMLGAVWSAALPVLSGFILGISGLGMRANAIRVLESNYIRVARLRGLSVTRIANRYVARNAILPLYTSLMIGIAGIFSSGIILERIFSYPAVGWFTYQSLVTRDYPLLMGAFIFYTGITIVGIFIADLTYGFIDPRASQGGNDEAY